MSTHLHHDPLWPRAGSLMDPTLPQADVALLGVPAHRTSLSATNAHTTPAALRAALQRYSTYATSANSDLRDIRLLDAGDIDGPDGADGEQRTSSTVASLLTRSQLALLIGGDNSITYAGAQGLAAVDDLDRIGLVTFDAHHDLRDGVSNGSPVRRLIDAGLPGQQVVQVGIADFANSAAYAERARDHGIHVITRAQLRELRPSDVMQQVQERLGDRPLYIDVDLDVCDRSVVPGCPAAAPGGISADELRQLVRLSAALPTTRVMDFTEVDATADTADERTVRLMALCVLEALAGFKSRA